MRGLLIVLLLAVVWMMVSCSAANPAIPQTGDTEALKDCRAAESNRWVWGNWRMYIPEDHSSISITPAREANLHYNVKTLLENGPCDNCIWISGFKNNGDGTVSVDISIRHPYPGNKFYTGFDVRGILYTTGRYWVTFDNEGSGDFIPSIIAGDPELLNPDCFTDAFKPYDPGWEKPPIFDYQPGGDLGATFDKDDVNFPTWTHWPYINYYSSDVRRQFAYHAVVERTYHVALPSGEWEFGYTIDACWAEPTVFPVTNIETDFPPQANTLFPYWIDAFVSGPLIGQEPVDLTVRVYHHLPEVLPYFDYVSIEPQCFMDPDTHFKLENPVIIDDKYVEFKGSIYNKGIDLYNPTPLLPGRYALHIRYHWAEGGPSMHDIEKGWNRNAVIQQYIWVTVE